MFSKDPGRFNTPSGKRFQDIGKDLETTVRWRSNTGQDGSVI